jgi:glycosyltransferase involved in cell wall biosynthesis
MLRIFKHSEAFSRGLEDRFSPKMEDWLNKSGICSVVKNIWSDFWARVLFFSNLPYAYRLFIYGVAPINCWIHSLKIEANDVVWISGPPIPDTRCRLERKVIQRGASYIFWIEDDWFSDDKLRPSAEARVDIADLVVAVTPSLRDRIRELYPGKSVIALEEPVDVDRLNPNGTSRDSEKPLVIWGGRPWAIDKLLMIDDVLRRVYRDVPFILRIITGTEKPEINFSIPWEWVPYDPKREAEYAAGAVAGLAPLENTVFNSCKGNYKVKTYMAMGVPPLTSPVGYNNHLIRNGETGFLVNSEMEWEAALRKLLKDASFSKTVGAAARAETIKRYSYQALMPLWAEALQKAFPEKLVGKNPG